MTYEIEFKVTGLDEQNYNRIMELLKTIKQAEITVSQNNGKPIVSRSKCDYHAAFTFCGDNGITYCSNCGDPV